MSFGYDRQNNIVRFLKSGPADDQVAIPTPGITILISEGTRELVGFEVDLDEIQVIGEHRLNEWLAFAEANKDCEDAIALWDRWIAHQEGK